MTVTICKQRKNHPRVPLEVCCYHVEEKDPVCLQTWGTSGTVECPTARKIMEERNGNQTEQA